MLMPLALGWDMGVAGAVACLTLTLMLQAFSYAGFHSYVQVLRV
jgi:hypothetical protein